MERLGAQQLGRRVPVQVARGRDGLRWADVLLEAAQQLVVQVERHPANASGERERGGEELAQREGRLGERHRLPQRHEEGRPGRAGAGRLCARRRCAPGEERVALPEEAHELVARRDDGLLAHAEQRIEAHAKGADPLRVRVALGDAAEPVPVSGAERLTIVPERPLGEWHLGVGHGAWRRPRAAVQARMWHGRLCGKAQLTLSGAGVVCVLEQLTEHGELGGVAREDLVDQRALVHRDRLLRPPLLEERLPGELVHPLSHPGGGRVEVIRV